MRTTVAHIAREAGVSAATVDRVLNEREGVRARTREIVLQVATRLGYFGPVADSALHQVRLDFVMPAGTNSFIRTLKGHLLQEGKTREDVTVALHEIEGFDPERLSAKLRELRGRTDAVGLIGLDHPQVREEVNTLSRTGVKVATLVSDLPAVDKIGYVGVDNRAAGRLAGLLMGRFLPREGRQRVALFMGSHAYRGHEERQMGFRSILAEDFPELEIAGLAEISDDRDRSYAEASRFLDEGMLAGIYNIGSGNQGIARALRERHCERSTVFIGHDLTDATRLMLLDRTMDAVIDQNPRVEAREIIRLLASSVKGTREEEYLPRLQVVFRENIPAS